jgi:hypothetical protein
MLGKMTFYFTYTHREHGDYRRKAGEVYKDTQSNKAPITA